MARPDRRSSNVRCLLILGVGALSLVACSKTASTAPSSGGAAGSAMAPASAPAASASISTAKVSSVGTVLTNARGFTLYLLTKEDGGKLACTGSCASVWPPVLVPSGTTSATATGSVNRSMLGTVKLPDGRLEVTYGGHPLHTYSGDTAPGQANGQGIERIWFAVTPAGKPAKSSSSGGYGY